MSEPEVVVLADPAAVADAAADRIVGALVSAIDEDHRADWATTGGSTPIEIYRRLVETSRRDAVAWDDVHVWWGDDRYVPRDHPLSNVKPFDDVMLDVRDAAEGTAGGPRGVPIPVDQVHPFPTGQSIGIAHGAAWCASAYEATIRSDGPSLVDGWPAFDLLLVGVGGDGHLLSVFPGSATLGATEIALAVPAPTHIEPHVERVTLNPAVLAVARTVLVVITGSGKAEVVGEMLGDTRDPLRWPAQLARHDRAVWILDEAAAARLPR